MSCCPAPGSGVLEAATFALLDEQPPEAKASAWWNLAYDAGYGAGPAAFGLICVRTGYPAGFGLTGALIPRRDDPGRVPRAEGCGRLPLPAPRDRLPGSLRPGAAGTAGANSARAPPAPSRLRAPATPGSQDGPMKRASAQDRGGPT